MDEQPRRYRNLLALLWLPLVLVLVVPAVLLLGASYYVRAVAAAFAGLVRFLLGHNPPPPTTTLTQPPHIFEIGVPSPEKQE